MGGWNSPDYRSWQYRKNVFQSVNKEFKQSIPKNTSLFRIYQFRYFASLKTFGNFRLTDIQAPGQINIQTWFVVNRNDLEKDKYILGPHAVMLFHLRMFHFAIRESRITNIRQGLTGCKLIFKKIKIFNIAGTLYSLD